MHAAVAMAMYSATIIMRNVLFIQPTKLVQAERNAKFI